MKQRSRTENSIINSAMSIVTQVLTVVLNFAVKTVFIKMLNDEYLGVNGLFTNIITMLSLADLGIGIAIPYSLYKPLAKKDEHKINVLMNFYKKVYTIIGIAVLLIGLSLTPFLGLIIKDIPKNVPHLSLIYILFVIHSASSYFFVYKKFLIDSDQKGYITSRIIFTFSTLLSIIQIILLVTTKNYILFLLSSIILVIIQNIYISSKANKLYPFIKNKTDEKLEKDIDKTEKKDAETVETQADNADADNTASDAEAAGDTDNDKSDNKKKDPRDAVIDELQDRVKRQMAEFDNYRKRTDKEKSAMFEMGASDVIKKLLPIVDNFERGFKAITDEEKETPFAKGMDMVYKQTMKMLEDLEVKPIEAVGLEFNPDVHNAVMHVEDDSVGEGIVVEEFEKGYTYRDTVIRHSMVKVAN